jgi:hypothetical protein
MKNGLFYLFSYSYEILICPDAKFKGTNMGKTKETEFADYDDELLDEEEDCVEPDLADVDVDDLLEDEETPGFKRTWRDAEKYKEIRELYKIINDDLYTGFEADEFPDEDGQ